MDQIGLEQICNINSNIPVNPKNLICSICFCININAKECLNKKCQKLICKNCLDAMPGYIKNTENEKFKKCPFCRTNYDFTNADEYLKEIINNLKFFCQNFKCDIKYNLNQYLQHLKNKEHNNNNKIEDFKPFKCENCLNQINESNLQKCFNCKISICKNCNNFCKKTNTAEILCGLCSILCQKCKKNEGEIICNLCNKILCQKCSYFCEEELCQKFICKDSEICYKEKIKDCKNCSNLNINMFYNKCSHQIYFNCDLCFPKCNHKNDKKNYNKGNINSNSINLINNDFTCKICDNSVCIKNCTRKCKSCKNLVCKSCMKFCKICKKYSCKECLEFCENCNDGIFFCKNCNTDVIRKCNFIKCSKKLCLACWNVCNFCNIIFCRDHSISCINCEEQCCLDHNFNCKSCNKSEDDEKFKKLCLKKCTYKCSFCDCTTNYYCDKNKHQVKNLNCGHNLCKDCGKGCKKCGNTVVSCPKCIVNYYFHLCKFCNSYLCQPCAKFCDKCEDVYCSLDHFCLNCGNNSIDKIYKNKSKEECLNCYCTTKSSCCECKIKLENCDECFNKYFCSINCYFEIKNKNKNLHLCEMFICKKDKNKIFGNIKLTEKIIPQNKNIDTFINKNKISNNEIIIENINPNIKINLNIKDNNKNSKKPNTRNFEKTNVGCLQSCLIF